MDNNDTWKAIIIGSIRLKCYDRFIRILTDVRYVPNLEKKLISFGVLEFKGFTVSIRNRVLKVIPDALVVMKCIRKNNLYYL